MITGIILVILSALASYYIYNSDLEDSIIAPSSFGRFKLYLGIVVILVIGIVSIVKDL